MFGCHNCGTIPAKNEKFEETPCATCRAARDPSIQAFQPMDPAVCQKIDIMHPAYEECDEFSLEAHLKEKIFNALSQTIFRLIRIRDKSPETFRVVEAKMTQPLLSYSELAKQLSCRKQNILYHLKKAVRICPELSFALIVDTRCNRGYQVVARKIRSGRARKNN